MAILRSDDGMQFSTSQPDLAAAGSEALLQLTGCKGQVSFSQPIKPEHMLLATQLMCTPGASQVGTTATSRSFTVKSLPVWLQRLVDVINDIDVKSDALTRRGVVIATC